jgi:hypothetical protein
VIVLIVSLTGPSARRRNQLARSQERYAAASEYPARRSLSIEQMALQEEFFGRDGAAARVGYLVCGQLRCRAAEVVIPGAEYVMILVPGPVVAYVVSSARPAARVAAILGGAAQGPGKGVCDVRAVPAFQVPGPALSCRCGAGRLAPGVGDW